MNKKDILNTIEFIRDECLPTDEFMLRCSTGSRAIKNFESSLGICAKALNLLDESDFDFYWHVYSLNWDNLNKETLTEDNIIIPKEVPFEINTSVLVSTSGYEFYRQKFELYSENSYYYSYQNGNIDPTEGTLINENMTHYETHGWDAEFKKINSLIEESNITNEIKLKKLITMKQIIENKINELKQI